MLTIMFQGLWAYIKTKPMQHLNVLKIKMHIFGIGRRKFDM